MATRARPLPNAGRRRSRGGRERRRTRKPRRYGVHSVIVTDCEPAWNGSKSNDPGPVKFIVNGAFELADPCAAVSTTLPLPVPVSRSAPDGTKYVPPTVKVDTVPDTSVPPCAGGATVVGAVQLLAGGLPAGGFSLDDVGLFSPHAT